MTRSQSLSDQADRESDRERPRRDPGRRSRRRNRQNDRARPSHRPRHRNRPREHHRNRLRDVHRKSRRRAEAPAARSARRSAQRRSSGRFVAERDFVALRLTPISPARRSSNQHHPRFLRRSASRTSRRSARRSSVHASSPKPRRGACTTPRFNAWFQEQLADPPEGIQRSLRRPVFSGLRRRRGQRRRPCRSAAECRLGADSVARFQGRLAAAAVRSRARVSMRWSISCGEFAEMSSDPDSRYDNFHFDTQAARQLSERSIAPKP